MKQIEIYQSFNGNLLNDCFSHLVFQDGTSESQLAVGEEYELIYRGIFLGIVEVKALRSVLFCRLSEVLSYLYCGRDLHYLSAMLTRQHAGPGRSLPADAIFAHAVLGYTEKDIEGHRKMFDERWSEIESDYYTLKK